ncbi:FecCD family ABC transporter permease [Lyngbya confervoides]|uniref:Iron ABC transporter permease n=1 Tax=Lyngbya confervoides BDU141951 TaxID=1574623 RepID=A0ABD4T348_9CYAN|nr:iron ABC transporter permease [Lyngbya confervoides]MCM1982913.1 iron ABC transporter permease [Lyngbya confervoides BDU141951]
MVSQLKPPFPAGLVLDRWHWLLLLLIGLMGSCLVALMFGSIAINPLALMRALMRQGSELHQTVIWDLRLPRLATAVAVGSALGMAGALLQGMLRNDLADPFILGISSGAGLVAIALITLNLFLIWLPLAAWVGALFTSLVVFSLGKTAMGITVERLILAGVAVSAFLGAIQTVLLLFSEDSRLQTALNWLIGSLNGRGWADLIPVLPYILVSLLLGCFLGRLINLLNLGDEMAAGLGVNLGRSRLLIASVAALLAASSVSVAGLIGFIGLVVPHGVRLVVGHDYTWVIPLSAVAGAWVLVLTDSLARLGSVELPVGAITALLGAPTFIVLLYRRSV